MALFDRYPPHVRKMIALGITIAAAISLVILMVYVYTTQSVTPNESGSKLKNFYTTIMSSGQSDSAAK